MPYSRERGARCQNRGALRRLREYLLQVPLEGASPEPTPEILLQDGFRLLDPGVGRIASDAIEDGFHPGDDVPGVARFVHEESRRAAGPVGTRGGGVVAG